MPALKLEALGHERDELFADRVCRNVGERTAQLIDDAVLLSALLTNGAQTERERVLVAGRLGRGSLIISQR